MIRRLWLIVPQTYYGWHPIVLSCFPSRGGSLIPPLRIDATIGVAYYPVMAFMPQWELLHTKVEQAQRGQILCKGEKRGNTPMEQGFIRGVTGRETGGNELAPPVANSCGGRGKFLRRTCECLAAVAKRLGFLGFWRWITRRSNCTNLLQRYKKNRKNPNNFVTLQHYLGKKFDVSLRVR